VGFGPSSFVQWTSPEKAPCPELMSCTSLQKVSPSYRIKAAGWSLQSGALLSLLGTAARAACCRFESGSERAVLTAVAVVWEAAAAFCLELAAS